MSVLAVPLLLLLPAPAAAQQSQAVVQSLVSEITDDGIAFTISTDRETHYRHFELEGPPRLVVDFYDASNQLSFRDRPVNQGGVLRVRAGQFGEGRASAARIVFDLERRQTYRVTADKPGEVRIWFPTSPLDRVSTGSAVPVVPDGPPPEENRLTVRVVDGQVSVSAIEVPLSRLLAELDAVANTESLVRAELAAFPVSVQFQDLPLNRAIREILRPLPVDYSVVGGNRITVRALSEAPVN